MADEEDSLLREEQPAEDAASGEPMSVLDHLEDLRRTVIACVLVLAVSSGSIGLFVSEFFGFLQRPLAQAMSETSGEMQGLITTGAMSVFSVLMQVVFLGGFFLGLPFMLYFVGRFLSPALNEHERKWIIPLCVAALVLFIVGAAFSYFVLVPISLQISLHFNEMFGLNPLWEASRYYGLLVWMVMGVGVAFEFPLVVLGLVLMRIVNTEQLRRFRPYSIVLFLVIAALITPTPDPFTFLLLAGPMMLFYELSILLSVRFVRRREETEPSGIEDFPEDL